LSELKLLKQRLKKKRTEKMKIKFKKSYGLYDMFYPQNKVDVLITNKNKTIPKFCPKLQLALKNSRSLFHKRTYDYVI
jgi:hypothetical protein